MGMGDRGARHGARRSVQAMTPAAAKRDAAHKRETKP